MKKLIFQQLVSPIIETFLVRKTLSLPFLILSLISFQQGHSQNQFKFDFGTGQTAAGYQQVTATTLYNEATGFGFDLGSQAVALDRGGANDLTRDFCTGVTPIFFSVKVPQGNYRVTVTLGDAWQSSNTTIKAESRRLMVEKIVTRPAEFKTVSFVVNVWDSIINEKEVVKLKPREVDDLDWDNKLTLEFSNNRPCINAVEIEKITHVPTIYLMGNSTVTNQSLEPWASWGQMITTFLNSEIAVSNHAASGSTLKASLSRKRLKKVASMLRPGDYVFIEFAHNDQKKGSGEEAYTTYNELLKTYIDTARNHGAIPVLVTSTHRRNFDAQGKIVNTLGDFPDAMRKEAGESKVALIDLNQMTQILYEAMGEEGSKRLFVQYPAGTFPGQKDELADNTHFSDFGAYELAKCVAEGIKKNLPDLVRYLNNDYNTFDPAHPDDFTKWDLPVSPLFTSMKPYGN